MHLFDYIIDLIVFPSDVYHMWIPPLDIVLKKKDKKLKKKLILSWSVNKIPASYTQTNFGSSLTLSISYIIERFYPF